MRKHIRIINKNLSSVLYCLKHKSREKGLKTLLSTLFRINAMIQEAFEFDIEKVNYFDKNFYQIFYVLFDNLREIESALKKKDNVLLIDIIQYELQPYFREWIKWEKIFRKNKSLK